MAIPAVLTVYRIIEYDFPLEMIHFSMICVLILHSFLYDMIYDYRFEMTVFFRTPDGVCSGCPMFNTMCKNSGQNVLNIEQSAEYRFL